MAKKQKEIRFNSRVPQYAWLSAFFQAPFIAPLGKKMVLFKSREHYYQAHKTKDKHFRSLIINAGESSRAKYFGSAKSGCPIVEDFDKGRSKLMREAIRYQFHQNALLLRWLKETEGATLIEEAPWDDYFGTGRDGNGKNVHGKLLMEFRDDEAGLGKKITQYRMAHVTLDEVYFYVEVKNKRD